MLSDLPSIYSVGFQIVLPLKVTDFSRLNGMMELSL